METRPRPVPTGPVVSPEVIATIIRHTQVPPSYRRMFLTEFCEAFTEHDETFDAEAFLAAADVITERKDVV